MDLGVHLESLPGSQSSFREGACTCAFLPSCGSSVALPFAWIKGSVAFHRGFPRRLSQEAFPGGFPTGLSHVPPWCESILGLKVEAVQGKQVPWNGLRHLGDSGNGGTTLEFRSPFLWRAPPLEMRRKHREFFPEHAGKGSLHRSSRRKRGSSGCGQESRASSRVETGKSGNFLSCSKGVKDPLEFPEVRCE